MKTLRQEKGMVLLLVLVVVALLASLLTEFAFSTLVDMRLTETYRDSTKAYYLAKGGVRVGRMVLQQDSNSYDARNDPEELWSQGLTNFPVGDGAVTITIDDQDSRLDINRIVIANGQNPDPDFLPRFVHLFEGLGMPTTEAEDLAAALVDWIDKDDIPFQTTGFGAEDAYYQRLEKPYHAKNGTLDSLAELALVRGFTPEVIKLIAPHVTLHGNTTVNVNTASREVLTAVAEWGAAGRQDAESAAEAILAYRESVPFKNSQEINALPEMVNLGYVGSTFFSVKSNFYRIESWGGVNDGARRVEAVVRKSDDKLLYFKVN